MGRRATREFSDCLRHRLHAFTFSSILLYPLPAGLPSTSTRHTQQLPGCSALLEFIGFVARKPSLIWEEKGIGMEPPAAHTWYSCYYYRRCLGGRERRRFFPRPSALARALVRRLLVKAKGKWNKVGPRNKPRKNGNTAPTLWSLRRKGSTASTATTTTGFSPNKVSPRQGTMYYSTWYQAGGCSLQAFWFPLNAACC